MFLVTNSSIKVNLQHGLLHTFFHPFTSISEAQIMQCFTSLGDIFHSSSSPDILFFRGLIEMNACKRRYSHGQTRIRKVILKRATVCHSLISITTLTTYEMTFGMYTAKHGYYMSNIPREFPRLPGRATKKQFRR